MTLITCTNATGTHKIPLAMIGKAEHPRCFRAKSCPLPYKAQKNAWNDYTLTKWWFHDVFLPEVKKRTSNKVALIADNFGSHDPDDTLLQDPQVEWVLLPPNCTSVHQPMDQGIIAALKRRYKRQLLQVMVSNLEKYDELRQLGAYMAAGVRGIQHAYPANLLDASTMAHEAWKELTQVTIVDCWLQSKILPQAHVDALKQFVLAYKRPVRAPVIDELNLLLKNVDLQAVCQQPVEADHSHENHYLGEMSTLNLLAKNDTDQFRNTIQDWFTIEDNDIVKNDEVEMVLQNEIGLEKKDLEESDVEESVQEPAFDDLELEPDSIDDISDGEMPPPTVTRKDILNQVDLNEALQMAKKLHEMMAKLGEDDTSHLLTTVYGKCLDLKAEKSKLNSRQTVLPDHFTQITGSASNETEEHMQT